MKKKKLLIVGDFISGSGLTQFIFNIFPYFDKNKFKIQCVGYGVDQTQEVNYRCQKLGWHLDRVMPITKHPLEHIKWWRSFFKKNDFDFIYFNYSSSWNYIPLKLAKRYTHAKIICHSHSVYYSHTFNNKILMKLLDRLNSKGKKVFDKDADLKLATSKDAALWMFATLKGVIIVNNGIELDRYKFDKVARKKLRASLDIATDEKLIGFAGVLREQKNPLFAIKIFANYLQKNPKSTLLIIGRGPLKNEIKKTVKGLKLSKKVKFIEYTSELNKWYSAMDILLFPSLHEGFGLVPLEAQVSNLQILASNNIASRVFVTKNINKISNFEEGSWNKALKNLKVKTEEQRNELNPLLEEFDVKRQVAKISNLLESETKEEL